MTLEVCNFEFSNLFFNIIFFEGLNLTPEFNAAGAEFTPKLNAFANNLTRWDLTVQDVQVKFL